MEFTFTFTWHKGIWLFISFFAVSLVMGIPTVKREKQSYLMSTLHSLLYGLSEKQKNDCVIIIFVAEVSLHEKGRDTNRKTTQKFLSQYERVEGVAKYHLQALWRVSSVLDETVFICGEYCNSDVWRGKNAHTTFINTADAIRFWYKNHTNLFYLQIVRYWKYEKFFTEEFHRTWKKWIYSV